MKEYELKNGMPIQKVSTSQKTDEWFKESAKAAFNLALREGDYGRKTYAEKIELFDLYDGIINEKNMEESFNTIGVDKFKFAPKFQHYPLLSPRVDLLMGELSKREFEYTIVSVNPDSISAKLDSRKQEFIAMMQEFYTDESLDEEYIKGRLDEFQKLDPRSIAEIQIDELLNYYSLLLDFKSTDEDLLKTYLIVGEKIGVVELVNGKTNVRQCDSLMTLTARDGGSSKVADAEIIVEVEFRPVGSIIEEYRDDLKESDIDVLIGKKESSQIGSIFGGMGNGDSDTFPTLVFEDIDTLSKFTNSNTNINQVYDGDGNIRIATVKWKGFRQVYRLKEYIDGEITYRYVSEKYKIDKSKGEEVEKKWWTEWHETVLIANDIWARNKISNLQFRNYSDPFESKSGYFGNYNITAKGKARSLMDRGRSLSYYYDMVFARLEDLLAKNIGKVIELDMAKMPEGWNPKLWLYYLKAHQVAVVNSFKSGDKGLAMGKLAGAYNTTGRGIDMELSNSIYIYIDILSKVESIISKVTGITDQRLGEISARELVGNVERSTIQSNHITEGYFNELDKTRLEYYGLAMEAIKFSHAEDNTLLQYAKDDKEMMTIKVNGGAISYEEMGIFPVDNTKNTNFAQILRNALQQQFSSGNGDVSTLIAAHSTNSIAKLRKLHSELEELARTRQQEAIKAQAAAEQEAKTAIIELEMKRDQMKYDHEMNMLDRELAVKESAILRDTDNDGIQDNVQIKVTEMNNDVKREEIEAKERIEDKKIEVSKRKTITK